MKKLTIVFVILFTQTLGAQEKPESSSDGMSFEGGVKLLKKANPEYKYSPVIPEFWLEFQKNLKESKFNRILKDAEKQINSYGEASPEGSEAQITQGHALVGMNLNYSAFQLYLKIAKQQVGTAVGNYALLLLSEIVQKSNYDEKAIMQFVDTYDISNTHFEITSFYHFFKSRHLLKYGLVEWAKESLMQIDETTYWHLLRRYHSGLTMVAKNDIDMAKTRFEELLKHPKMEKPLLDKVRLQLARIHFEKGEFKEANNLYDSLRDFQIREKGRVLLEKSWTKFYLGEYAEALGILYSLNSPYFFSSITPERYILEMLIFKQLCHYDAVNRTAKRFKKRFGRSIKTIRDRLPLNLDPILFNMSVLPLTIQMEANLVSQIGEEITDLNKFKWKEFSFYKPLMSHLKYKKRQLQAEVDLVILRSVKPAANEILKSMEQVQFLDYAASIDKLSVEGNKFETYKSNRIPKFQFDQLYWPTSNEYWFDELEDYKMQISSKCLEEGDSKEKIKEENFR